MSMMDEATQEFINECIEMLERVSNALTDIEKSGGNTEKYSSLYRDIHTIKGSSQLFGFNQMGYIAHAIEASLDPVRKNKIPLCRATVDLILKGIDRLQQMIGTIKTSKTEGDNQAFLEDFIPRIVELLSEKFDPHFSLIRDDFVDYEWLPQEESLITPKAEAKTQVESNIPMYTTATPSGEDSHKQVSQLAPTALATEKAKQANAANEHEEALSLQSKIEAKEKAMKKAMTQAKTHTPAPAPKETQASKVESSVPQLAVAAQASIHHPSNGQAAAIANPSAHPAEKGALDNQDSIRVQVNVLDKLMNLAGELVLVRNQMLRYASVHAKKNPELSRLSQKINAVTSEVQIEVMKTRMQPIGSILSKFNRMIRDLSHDLAKKIELKLEGTETELDKALIEAVKDPLTHIIRNSADHGIEGPAERKAKGKPEQGIITVRSFHEGGQVVIEVSDNGRGLNRQRIAQKALEKAIISQDDAQQLSDNEIYQLIFAPGFSTAEQVSSISGRGVGMDVVKTNIEKIGGLVELSTVPEQSTTIRLKIPLTLAIVPALIIRSGGGRFAIPQVKLLEVLRVNRKGDSTHPGLEWMHEKPIYRLRGQILPLINLQDLLQVPSQLSQRSLLLEEDKENIVVLKAGQATFGIMVDEIEDNADIVVKPIPGFLKNIALYSGATVLGDGTVALAFDVMGIAEKAGLNINSEARSYQANFESDQQKIESSTIDYIIFDIGDQVPYAIPLSLVNRLEEFKNRIFELTGNKKVVQYRQKLLPILSASEHLQNLSPHIQKYLSHPEHEDLEHTYPVLVLSSQEKTIGLQARKIIDIISVSAEIDDTIRGHDGILGSFLYKQKIFTVLNAFYLIETCLGFKFANLDPSQSEQLSNKHLLVVEDSSFFRKHMEKLFRDAGMKVTTAADGQDAFDQFERAGVHFDAVVSDIEMPKLDGFGLAQKIRSRQNGQVIPLIAVTTRFRQADIDHGKEVGFNAYLEKLNEEQLLQTVKQFLGKEAA